MLFVAPAGAAGSGSKLWRSFYDAGGVQSAANATAASPDGTKVFVTGSADGAPGEGRNYATVAYNASTGAQLWVATFTSTLNGAPVPYDDVAYAVAVSRDGTKVYVTGKSRGAFVTIAYNTTTGARVWQRLYTAVGPATAITVSPDGSAVFITGDGTNATPNQPYDFATVAYNAVTGTTLWFSTFNGAANMNDYARDITVTPDSSRVIMTGYDDDRYVTIAYEATTGAQLWISLFNPVNFAVQAYSIAMSPDGSFVAVTGQAGTIAYDTMTGAQRWATGSDVHGWVGVAVAPDATRVYVTGNYLTVAYAADTGNTLWASTYDGPAQGSGNSVALDVSDDGNKVVVTGTSSGGPYLSFDYATIAYDATTGAQSWVTRHNFVSLQSNDQARAMTIVPGANTVVVTGNRVPGPFSDLDFATAAIAL